ncbi:hypothetical protein BD626DRAFT_635474 [Schizophyllum amplum]|uniref:C2H2-type domain-containing protein n=1 Tax=Schizophyllum amplum TaxID=97359 RepID=A0A550BW15_9AGAR|nr:hypothetical protein BD626DRAFT_635474 [Auriculariopsis ampla]
MPAAPHVSVSGSLSNKDRIKSLRTMYKLSDTDTVPATSGNHLVCRLSPTCEWIHRFRDDERATAPGLFIDHIREHVREEARHLRDLHHVPHALRGAIPLGVPNAIRAPAFPTATSLHRCSWHHCGQAFYKEERLINHIVQEHLRLSTGVYCPLCAVLIAVQVSADAHDQPDAGNNGQDMLPPVFAFIGGQKRTLKTVIFPGNIRLSDAPLTKDHPVLVALQDILLEHYEAAKCDTLRWMRITTLKEDKMSRIEAWRDKTNARD